MPTHHQQPSRPANSFICYRSALAREWKKKPGVKQDDLSKLAGRMWGELTPSEKRPYEEMAKNFKKSGVPTAPEPAPSKKKQNTAGSERKSRMRKAATKQPLAIKTSSDVCSSDVAEPKVPNRVDAPQPFRSIGVGTSVSEPVPAPQPFPEPGHSSDPESVADPCGLDVDLCMDAAQDRYQLQRGRIHVDFEQEVVGLSNANVEEPASDVSLDDEELANRFLNWPKAE